MNRFSLIAGCLLSGLGVALGAFGAHGLRNVLGAAELGWWHTAVQYQMWHATGLLALGAGRLPNIGPAAVLLVLGTLVFSGSLYAMALSGWRVLGMITPIGGTLMIAGWLLLAWRALRA
ncbi:DUF423 domain-containing protein [Aromatoleum toluclasticum]|uniref:DUF423 domain-containing protein n=1 Tax=Aromatoleum toluclasticum TaxID=92003 RepID=UPI0003792266|nr:DUF423 domain-containing protein [Aromatoleum toluclasticum]MCC4117352.1 DUF423 domain-containing protein [Aromatoleum toluclasticum]